MEKAFICDKPMYAQSWEGYVCEGQAIAMYAQSWEGLGLWGTSQSMHSPEKVYVCEGQAIAM